MTSTPAPLHKGLEVRRLVITDDQTACTDVNPFLENISGHNEVFAANFEFIKCISLHIPMKDSQKQSEWAFYINVYETIFMELVKCPGYIKEAREIVSVTSPKARLLAQRICIAGDRLRTLSDELRSLLASHNQRKEGIIFRSFVGPQPNAFPETSPSLLLRAAVTATSILKELFIRLTTPAYAKGESPSSSRGTPQSVGVSGAGGPLLDFRFTFELGGRTEKDNPCHFTWLDRVAGSMGLLGAEITYVE